MRNEELKFSPCTGSSRWSFDTPADVFKLGIEAARLQFAHLFDPMMAVHASKIDPLPHQLSAVYETMLPRQPFRFVLADDPGAGKTIMAGLLIREMLMRSDVKRVLIVAPGSLTEQWQDEMHEKFDIHFNLFHNNPAAGMQAANFFLEQKLVIARIHQLANNDTYKRLLKDSTANALWDLIIVDEAHKMAAHNTPRGIEKTNLFKLGELLGEICRNFLLMTATPHNGKESEFRLFMSLIDKDRFYNAHRRLNQKINIDDTMRRLLKEDLKKFDGSPLFPERRAYTANYSLTDMESDLYKKVTYYVCEEMNRANLIGGQRKGSIGFALTQLQRRLASSPNAIYKSLQRRGNKLQDRLQLIENQNLNIQDLAKIDIPDKFLSELDDCNITEYEKYTDTLTELATAANTIPELKAEIIKLKELEECALSLCNSGCDRKWDELSKILINTPEMYNSDGQRRKLIIFTEHKDTLFYLAKRIKSLLGNDNAIVIIHGGVSREQRSLAQQKFRNNNNVLILIATDAAGEGVNLQNANLMVNYDLPWNPNRLEQRFGRIHRIGQTEICHLWNLVANETREGAVFSALLNKIEIEREALDGRVYDILGEAFVNISLQSLLIDAIKNNGNAVIAVQLKEKIEETLDHDNLLNILKNNALTEYHLESTSTKINLEKSQAKKLQPYFIQEFFTAAFERLNGTMINFNNGLYNISNVPPQLQLHAFNMIDNVFPIQHEYEKVCFDKNFIKQKKGEIAELLHTDHPLVKAVINMTKINTRLDLKNSSIFLDPTDISDQHYIFFVIEHSLHSNTKTLSNKLFFLKFNKNGFSSNLEWSSHINLQEISLEDRDLLKNILSDEWINKDINNTAIKYTADNLVPLHYNEIKEGLSKHADKIKNTVRERLNSEIDAITLQAIELGGQGEELRANNAYKSANELTTHLHERLRKLDEMQKIVSNTPILLSAALIIPQGLLLKQKKFIEYNPEIIEMEKLKKQALDIVIASEEKNGNNPKNVCNEQCGWDITVQNKSNTSKPHHIKVKYLHKEQPELLLTPLEIIYGLNQADQFILAIVFFDNNNFDSLFYLKEPFSYDSRWKSDIIWPTNQKLFTMKDFMEHAKPVCVN